MSEPIQVNSEIWDRLFGNSSNEGSTGLLTSVTGLASDLRAKESRISTLEGKVARLIIEQVPQLSTQIAELRTRLDDLENNLQDDEEETQEEPAPVTNSGITVQYTEFTDIETPLENQSGYSVNLSLKVGYNESDASQISEKETNIRTQLTSYFNLRGSIQEFSRQNQTTLETTLVSEINSTQFDGSNIIKEVDITDVIVLPTQTTEPEQSSTP